MFWKIHDDLLKFDDIFWGTREVLVVGSGVDSYVKIVAFLSILRTGESYDRLDYGERMGEETLRVYFQSFTTDLLHLYRNL